MKLFEMPYIEVLKFSVQDVIATSSTKPAPPADETEDDFCL